MKHLDLFSGIGGFALAVDAVWDNVEHTFCEIDPYCQQLLKLRFKGAKIYGDIRELRLDTNTNSDRCTVGQEEVNTTERGEQTFGDSEKCDGLTADTYGSGGGTSTSGTNKDGSQIDKGQNEQPQSKLSLPGCFILTGGFPCQPFSQAGKRKGTDDNRYLWPEMLRVIREFQPTWVIAENVRGLLTINEGMVFEQVCLDMEGEGYEVQPFIIPAVAVNAPHRRDRVWFVANCKGADSPKQAGEVDPRGSVVSRRETEIRFKSGRCDADAISEAIRNSKAEGCGQRNGQEARVSQRGMVECGQEGPEIRVDSGAIGERYDWSANWLEVATELCGVDDGLPAELDGLKLSKSRHRVERLKALGNAIVPQVAIEIMKAIKTSWI